MESLGTKIRKQRRRLGLSLAELAGRTAISKPYLSLIETGRLPNPPGDEKLRQLEQILGFGSGELLTQAHLQRTPRDVRAVLGKLLAEGETAGAAPVTIELKPMPPRDEDHPHFSETDTSDLPEILRQWAGRSAGELEKVSGNVVPVINRVASSYPKDFNDLSYPQRVADQYIGCPDIFDPQAFAARVHGDSMTPRYREGDIVIFSPALAARNGDDCFIRFNDGQTTFMRIFYENDSKNRLPILRLQPRNERQGPTIVQGEKIAGIYRAVYRYQRVDEQESE